METGTDARFDACRRIGSYEDASSQADDGDRTRLLGDVLAADDARRAEDIVLPIGDAI